MPNGLFQIKSSIYFSETPPPPGTFTFVPFTLRNPKENKVSLLHLETLQNCVAPLANSKVKSQKTHGWKFHRQHMSFS